MATYRDPEECFAPLEMIERLLQIRVDFGFPGELFLDKQGELADLLDAYGFDSYAYSGNHDSKINYGEYTASIIPGGDSVRSSFTAH
jgi:hypothetical protein